MVKPISSISRSQHILRAPEDDEIQEKLKDFTYEQKDNVGIIRYGKRTFKVKAFIGDEQAKVTEMTKLASLVAVFLLRKGVFTTPMSGPVGSSIIEERTDIWGKEVYHQTGHGVRDKEDFYDMCSLIDGFSRDKIKTANEHLAAPPVQQGLSPLVPMSGISDTGTVSEFANVKVEDVIDLPYNKNNLYFGLAIALEKPMDIKAYKQEITAYRHGKIKLIFNKRAQRLRTEVAANLGAFYEIDSYKNKIKSLIKEEIEARESFLKKTGTDKDISHQLIKKQRDTEKAYLEKLIKMSPEEYIKESENDLYGGPLAIFALAHLYGMPIKVIYKDRPSETFNKNGRGEPITLIQYSSFYKGNIYRLHIDEVTGKN